MSRHLAPPGQTEEVHAESALVLAPHYDDEVLGCGGVVAQLTAAGAVVRVLFLSDGGGTAASLEERRAYAAERRAEAARATAVLGVAGVDHLELPDGALGEQPEALERGIHRALVSQRPELVLVTSPLEASPDHRAAFQALHRLLGSLRGGSAEPLARSLTVLAYEVNHPLYPNLLVDVTRELPRLRQAMGCYESQQRQHDYLGARLGLLRFRALTLPPEVEAAEAYRRLELSDFVTRSPAALVRELGGVAPRLTVETGPRLSVVVRTKDRPQLLAEALASLAESHYRRAEILVVNDGGETPQLPADHPLPIVAVELGENRGRAAAAAAGVERASGDYVTFLDDDDLAEPEHLATLAALVGAAGVRVAYTDAAVGVYELDGDEGWRCRERRLPYSRDFDPDLLLVDNYIPFNTLAIERRLVAEAGGFDPALPFFEDWDFLIRLASLTPFHHLPRVTCEYRQLRGGGHHVLGDRPRERDDFLAMKARVIAKHRRRLTPEVVARLVDRLRAETVAATEEERRASSELAERSRELHRLNGRLASVEIHRQGLVSEVHERRAETARLTSEVGALRGQLESLGAEARRLYGREQELVGAVEGQSATLGRTFAEIERLTALVREMESTRAWRLHRWWQRRRS